MAGQAGGKTKAHTASPSLSHLNEVNPGCGVKHLCVLSQGGCQTSLPPLRLAMESTGVVLTLLPERGGQLSEMGTQTALSSTRHAHGLALLSLDWEWEAWLKTRDIRDCSNSALNPAAP